LNRTPDSFFDGGEYFDFDSFIAKADDHVTAGADFLDVGGVKAGPGIEITPEEELDRVVPAVAALAERFDLPISIDTFRASVADECYRAGAVIGNDISGFADPEYLRVAAQHGASVVACHIRLAPRVPDPEPHYDDLRGEVSTFLSTRARWALRAGIPPSRVMLDAGLDLGKTEQMSAMLLGATGDLTQLGFPVFLSASNKRFLGALTGTETENRNDASHAAHVIGITKGARILRAHDVAGSRRVADVTAAILKQQVSLEDR
jgi:dihydropteroate synthase